MRTSARKKKTAGTLIVDPAGGLSGDMFLGCLLSLGAGPREIEREVSTLPGLEPVRISARRVKRNAISAMQVRIQCKGKSKARDLETILRMIKRSSLDVRVKRIACETFLALGEVEGKIHGVPAEKVHFHEVGAVDSIVDITGAAVALSLLGFPRIFHRPFVLGGGTMTIAHGTVPVPAPATIELLKGRTVTFDRSAGEVVTPTGAALMKTLASELPAGMPLRPSRIVYAAGTRKPADGPGLLRVIEVAEAIPGRTMAVLRTTIDDMIPEQYGFVAEKLFGEGAREVYLTQIIMKKGRPGVELTVLCETDDIERMIGIIMEETTTLGIRI